MQAVVINTVSQPSIAVAPELVYFARLLSHYIANPYSYNMVNASSLLPSASSTEISGDLSESINALSGSAGINVDAILAFPAAVQLLFCVIVLRVFYKLPNLRTSTNFPIINLIASDFMRAVLSFLAIPLFSGSNPDAIDKFHARMKSFVKLFGFVTIFNLLGQVGRSPCCHTVVLTSSSTCSVRLSARNVSGRGA